MARTDEADDGEADDGERAVRRAVHRASSDRADDARERSSSDAAGSKRLRPGDEDPVIEVRGASVRYGQVRALAAATLSVGQGRICALVGMNGSGKSTLMKVMLGLVGPHPGQVLLNGAPPSSARRRGLIAYVPQREDVDWTFPTTVREVVMTGRYAHLGLTRRARTGDHRIVDEALDRVDLTELAGRQIGRLSGGQRKRAFVARAIAQQAQVLLLDEPFAGVDDLSRGAVSTLLRSLADDGATIVIATHDLPALPSLADEAALLAGTVVMHDSVHEVIRPENLARAFGLGEP